MPHGEDEIVSAGDSSGTGRAVRTFDKGRICQEPGCGTALSIYNKGRYCYLHEPLVVPRTRGRKKIA